MLLEIISSFAILGAAGTSGNMPFWATSNRYGLMPESTGALAIASVSADSCRLKGLWSYGWGATMAVRSDGTDAFEIIPAECYASLGWWNMSAEVGIRHRDKEYLATDPMLGSISLSSGSMAWSGNTRSYPGVTLKLEPTDLVPCRPGLIQIWGSYGDYYMTDERYVHDGLLHTMKAFARASWKGLSFTAGLDHFAQWAGWNEDYGNFPSSISDYWRLIRGKSAGSNGTICDQLNVLGDHFGAETFKLAYSRPGWTLSFQHDIPYTDKSGMRFQNFPDGVNTLYLSFPDKSRWISDIAIEYVNTRNQSGLYHDRPATEEEMARQDPDDWRYGKIILGGLDNYGNNSEYRSGCTIYGRSTYMPLFLPKGTHDGKWSRKGITLGIENNLLCAWHLGLSGSISHTLPYRLMCTWSRNCGLYYRNNDVTYESWHNLEQLSLGMDIMTHPGAKGLQGFAGIYLDTGDVLPKSVALILGASRRF